MSNISIHVLFHIHFLIIFLLLFSIVKFSIGAIVDILIPLSIIIPCILKHGSNMFLSPKQYFETCL